MGSYFDAIVYYNSIERPCSKCGQLQAVKAWITRPVPSVVLCLRCAGLDHLVYLPSGDACLTRRAQKYSELSAVLMWFSKARKRNERQGILVEKKALAQAEESCQKDLARREKQQARDAIRRARADSRYQGQFCSKLQELYPGCPDEIASEITTHACEINSGRVGRSHNARNLDEYSIGLAVRAYIRHNMTKYDDYLYSEEYPREVARDYVKDEIDEIEAAWARGLAKDPDTDSSSDQASIPDER